MFISKREYEKNLEKARRETEEKMWRERFESERNEENSRRFCELNDRIRKLELHVGFVKEEPACPYATKMGC